MRGLAVKPLLHGPLLVLAALGASPVEVGGAATGAAAQPTCQSHTDEPGHSEESEGSALLQQQQLHGRLGGQRHAAAHAGVPSWDDVKSWWHGAEGVADALPEAMNRTLDAWQIQAERFKAFGDTLKTGILTTANVTLEEKLPKFESFVNETLGRAAGFWQALALAMRAASSSIAEALKAAGKKDLGSKMNSTMTAALEKVTSFVGKLQEGADRCVGLTEQNAPAKLGELNATLEKIYLETDGFVGLVNDSFTKVVDGVKRAIWEESLLQVVGLAMGGGARMKWPDMGAALASVQRRAVGIAAQMGDAMHFVVFHVEKTMTDLGLPILQSGATRCRSLATTTFTMISVLILKS